MFSKFSALSPRLLAGAFLLALTPGMAVERTLEIVAPASVSVGREFSLTIAARTDAGNGEQVGFLQAEVSVDGGATWTAVCYLHQSGPRAESSATIKPGAVGSTVQVRARAAFRDGLAGDVDYTGAAIRWKAGWGNWKSPPAKHVTIPVVGS